MQLPPLNLNLNDDTRQQALGTLDGSGWSVATGGSSATSAAKPAATKPGGLPVPLIVGALVALAAWAYFKGR